jgi:probable HAF family extracellular repeat protein
MKINKSAAASVSALLAACAPGALAQVAFDLLPGDFAVQAMSRDGSWMVGSNNNGDVVRWSQGAGVEVLYSAAHYNGIMGISDDGSRVAASIYDNAGTATPGVWTQGQGWTTLGPIPGGGVDGEDGSAYGISGDGSTVTGLAWRSDWRARAFSWTDSTGMVNLGASYDDRSSRGTAINGDGSVIGGFDEAEFGNRRPAVWINGALTVLAPDGVGEILSLSHGGNFAGATGGFDTGANLWTNNGGVWTETVIGLLDGTDPFDHDAGTLGVSDDGSMAVGFNRSGFGPFADYDGFIWNEEGMVDVEIWLADNGIDVGNLDIRQLVDISGDGSVMAGWGYHDGFQISSFRITIVPAPASAALLGLGALAAVRRRR